MGLKGKIIIRIQNKWLILKRLPESFQDINTTKIWIIKQDDLELINKNSHLDNIIVLIISCEMRKKRQGIIRSTWLQQLRILEIPYLFIIGNNHTNPTRIIGDVLEVDTNDYYEGLPEKIIKCLEYIYNHTNYSYIYKIDDDCILQPLWLSHIVLKGHYIGITKSIDTKFNRLWHQGKCLNKKINNTPYPLNRIHLNTYHAKGESGYFLSREAIKCLLNHKQYIISDLYEDKVIGDILRKYGILLNSNCFYKAKLYNKELKQTQIDKFLIIVDVPENQQFILYHPQFINEIK
jgi:hypothetical protein